MIALSAGEAECYAPRKAASVSLGDKALYNDLGIKLAGPIEANSVASAAIGISHRVRAGKV